MTPHELNLHINEFSERKKHEHEERLLQAYLTAAWGFHTKRMPQWSDIVREPKKEMTDEQMLEKIKQLNARFGGTVSGV